MASVYTNDLRLEEIGSGEQSGTWGDTTNTNLELIAEGLSYGTEAITTNANTHTSTVADGATDPARSMYIEYTGTLDSACTITIAPNTLSRMHFIENGTSGSQNIIIKQGSGATITIPPGDTKAVYLDGAGSGAAVVDAFASLNVVDLKVQDDLTVTDDLVVGGVSSFADGSAGAPSITNTGDLDTGILFPAANSIAFSTAGTQRTLINADGFYDYLGGANDVARFGGPNSGSVTIRNDTANQLILHTGTSDALVLGTGGNNDRLTINAAGAATFSGTLGVTGVVTANAGVVVDEMTLDADTLTATDDFILDVVGDIDLNTDSGLITLKDDSVHFGSLYNSGSNLHVASTTQDKDILLQGMDGNTTLFTMLQLDASDAGAARFGNGTAALPSISNLGDTNTGIFFPAADTIAFAEGGNEIFKLDSSGNVGIKKDNTAIDTRLHIDNCPDNKVITFEQSGRKSCIGTIYAANSTNSRLDFHISNGNQNGGNVNTMSISASGDVKLITGNLVVGTAGKGIDFSATGNGGISTPNELLSDYEEGTFTPTQSYQNSSNNSAASVNAATGRYTLIGDICHFNVRMSVEVPSSPATDNYIIGSLPFTSINISDQDYICGVVITGTDITKSPVGQVPPNSTGCLITHTNQAGNYGSSLTAGTQIIKISGFYRIA